MSCNTDYIYRQNGLIGPWRSGATIRYIAILNERGNGCSHSGTNVLISQESKGYLIFMQSSVWAYTHNGRFENKIEPREMGVHSDN